MKTNERLKAESDRWWDEVRTVFERDEATPTNMKARPESLRNGSSSTRDQ